MSQTRLASFVEACANTLAGFIFSLVIQLVLNHTYEVEMSLSTATWFTFWFTVASIARSYIIRRIANKQFWKRK